MVQEIYNAILEPLRQTFTWYGIFLALAFHKHIRRFAEGAIRYAKQGGKFAKQKTLNRGNNSGQDGNNDNPNQ